MQKHRYGFTLVDVLTTLGIISILLALVIPAVQGARRSSNNINCLNNLKQIGVALHLHHDAMLSFPIGHRPFTKTEKKPYTGWPLEILPFLDQANLFKDSEQAFGIISLPFYEPPHHGLSTTIKVFVCPEDSRISGPQVPANEFFKVSFTSYLGNSGISGRDKLGVLYGSSKVSLTDIKDGSSNTLIVGERPPSSDLQYGWWYAGVGVDSNGLLDMTMGSSVPRFGLCQNSNPNYSNQNFRNPCSHYFYWSTHGAGGNFCFADGSVKKSLAAKNNVFDSLSTRSGGETYYD